MRTPNRLSHQRPTARNQHANLPMVASAVSQIEGCIFAIGLRSLNGLWHQ